MKADRAFRSRAIGGPGAKPAREWHLRQGVEPVCRRRGRMKADRAFRSRAIGGPGAKPAREWHLRQGVEPVCRRGGRKKAGRAFRSRAIGGPGAKPARQWQMRQGVEPVCRRRRRGRFVNRPYEGNEGCGVGWAWSCVLPAGGASPSPTKHRRNPNHVCRGGGLPRPHAAPVPCRPSASGPAVPEPIRSTSRQFPGVNASTSDLRRGSGGRLCTKPPGSVFSFLHRRGAFFLFDKAEKKEWGSQKRRVLVQYKRIELNGATSVCSGRGKPLPYIRAGGGRKTTGSFAALRMTVLGGRFTNRPHMPAGRREVDGPRKKRKNDRRGMHPFGGRFLCLVSQYS
jgi:hypothetical protein